MRPSAPVAARVRPALLPLLLPAEHGGWSLVLEPLLLGLLIFPSAGGVLIAIGIVLAFLVRQPLRLGLHDLSRRKSFPRTKYCWLLASGLGAASFIAMVAAVSSAHSLIILVPFLIVVPFVLMLLYFDRANRSRELIAELSGAIAMSSGTTSVALAGGEDLVLGGMLGFLILCRLVPAVVYVRAALRRHRSEMFLAILLHAAALGGCSLFWRAGALPAVAVAVMAILFARAVRGLSLPPVAARVVGRKEVLFGLLTLVLLTLAYRLDAPM